jgi:hypothetical protein
MDSMATASTHPFPIAAPRQEKNTERHKTQIHFGDGLSKARSSKALALWRAVERPGGFRKGLTHESSFHCGRTKGSGSGKGWYRAGQKRRKTSRQDLRPPRCTFGRSSPYSGEECRNGRSRNALESAGPRSGDCLRLPDYRRTLSPE